MATLTAQTWTAPTALQVEWMVKSSGLSQAKVAARAGLSLDRLKRLMGKKASGRAGEKPTPCAFGEWLALIVATAPKEGPHPHPLGLAAGNVAEAVADYHHSTKESPA